ncbi:contactin-2-like [Antedon mediterranea]|uniref:contactin-2-like n=1 Tax=Antedon mediterranea TaxID=105859 RepID=UPI003AF752C5
MLIYYSSFVITQMPTIYPTEIKSWVGDKATFECSTSDISLNMTKLRWFKTFNQMATQIAIDEGFINVRYELIIDGYKSTLTIINITVEDGKFQYSCEYGSVSSMTAILIIINGTKLDSRYPECQSDNSVVNTEKKLKMTCSASGGDPMPLLKWYRNGNNVTEQDQSQSSVDDLSYFAVLNHLLTADDESAIFTCKADGVAATVDQSCSIKLEIPPMVTIITNTTFVAGSSLEFTCKVMTPWNITTYIWKYGDQLVVPSTKFKLNSDNTELTISNLQSEDDKKVVECTAMTSSGLNGNDSVIISIYDSNDPNEEQEKSTLLIILVVAGAVVLILLVCLAMCILCQNRKRKGQTENRNQNVTSSYYENVLNKNETGDLELATSIHSYERRIDITARHENEGTVSYVNASSLDTFRIRPSDTSVGFDKDQEGNSTHDDDIDALYAQPVKSKASVVGLQTDFGELYAKPMKGVKVKLVTLTRK